MNSLPDLEAHFTLVLLKLCSPQHFQRSVEAFPIVFAPPDVPTIVKLAAIVLWSDYLTQMTANILLLL